MDLVVVVVIAGMVIFGVVSAAREISLYRRSVKGDLQYLVSKKRRNRRLLVSFILILEAALLVLGMFVFSFKSAAVALLFWVPPLLLIGFLIYLSILDFRETSRDVDKIFRESAEVILKKVDRTKIN